MNAQFSDLLIKVEPLLSPYAKRISVFGSYARGEATAQSDIDLLVALKSAEKRPPFGLFEVIRVEKELELALGRAVELVTEDGLSPRIAQSVERDKVILYEEA
jgi:uncharacterized protein